MFGIITNENYLLEENMILSNEGFFSSIKAILTNNYVELAAEYIEKISKGEIDEQQFAKMKLQYVDFNELKPLLNVDEFFKGIADVIKFLTSNNKRKEPDDFENAAGEFFSNMRESVVELTKAKGLVKNTVPFEPDDAKNVAQGIAYLTIVLKTSAKRVERMQIEKLMSQYTKMIDRLIASEGGSPLTAYARNAGQTTVYVNQEVALAFHTGMKYLRAYLEHIVKVCETYIAMYIKVLKKTAKVTRV